MKVTKIVAVKFESVYCGYREIEFTDSDGSEIKVRMTNEQWKVLGESVARKVREIEKSEQLGFEHRVEAEVGKRLESQSSEVLDLRPSMSDT